MTADPRISTTSELRQVVAFSLTMCCVLLGSAGALLAAGF